MNAMLMIVAERRAEIGLRRAVGATRRDIAMQLLCESIALSFAAGVLGCAFGAALAAVLLALNGYPVVLSGASWALGAGVAVGVGSIAGVYPAWRAASGAPLAALQAG